MNRFDLLFGLVLAERLLQHTNNLSKTLQAPSLTASEGHQVADLTCMTLSRIQSTEAFDLFWDRLQSLQREYGVDEASLPRKRKAPCHLEVGSGEAFYPSTAKDFYSHQYFECLDFIFNAIKDRFHQPGYKTLKQLENLLLKAARGEEYKDELAFVIDHYGDDFTPSSLTAQLEILTSAFLSSTDREKPTFTTIKEYVVSLSSAQRIPISEACTALKLILVTPATNAVSELSALVLRRVKTYLRATMSQLRLNNLLILHAHKDRTDDLSISSCLNEFVRGIEHRMSVFGDFII